MSSSERNAKIYGAVETETFMTFEGFCKKIYNTEQQRVEVFIDDEKIDTILANQKISNIEDTYEVFDTEGFCFTYKLPQKYIGEKHKLEFKTIEGEQLIHSPFSTIDISDEKYNEYFFLESLKEPIDEEKIKDLYCPNSIGFLATEKNLNDINFVEFIKNLSYKFPDTNFVVFYLSLSLKQLVLEIFSNQIHFTYIPLVNIYTITSNIEIYINSMSTENNVQQKIFDFLRLHCKKIYIQYTPELNLKKLTIKEYENEKKAEMKHLFDNLTYLGLEEGIEIDKNATYASLFYNHIMQKLINNYNFNDQITTYDSIIQSLEYALTYDEYKNYCYNMQLKSLWLRNNL